MVNKVLVREIGWLESVLMVAGTCLALATCSGETKSETPQVGWENCRLALDAATDLYRCQWGKEVCYTKGGSQNGPSCFLLP